MHGCPEASHVTAFLTMEGAGKAAMWSTSLLVLSGNVVFAGLGYVKGLSA